jgi:hypothetical protein
MQLSPVIWPTGSVYPDHDKYDDESKFYLFTNWCTSELSLKNNIKIYIKTPKYTILTTVTLVSMN